MYITDILLTFGLPLARLIKKDENIGPGLISLAIRDSGREIRNISYEDLESVFRFELRDRLLKLNISNTDTVVGEMLKILQDKQSLFTMATY